MNYRPVPLPDEQRAQLTEQLIKEHGTDLQRWAQFENLANQWDARAAMAAEWIPDHARVLDLGAGAMTLARLLKPGCCYTAADVVKRSPECQVIDLNRQQFPPEQYDWITLLGVLEYVHDIEWTLHRAYQAATNLLVTYCTHQGGNPAYRRAMGWVNDFSQTEFESRLTQCAWKIERRQEIKRSSTNIQLMYSCSHS